MKVVLGFLQVFFSIDFAVVVCCQVPYCCAPLLKDCSQHHVHNRDPRVTSGICGAIGERAQMILVWVRAPRHGNASHPQELGVTRVKPRVLDGSWHPNSRMLKNTSIGGVSKKL